MSAPSLDELFRATKSTTPAIKPARGDAFERLAAQSAADRERLRIQDVQRQAVDEAIKNFPDATPDQLLPIAREFETELERMSNPAVLAEQKKLAEAARAEQVAEGLGSLLVAGGGGLGTAVGGPAGGAVGAFAGGLMESGLRKLGGKDVSPMNALRNARNQATIEIFGFQAIDKTFGTVARWLRGNKAAADDIMEAFAATGMRPALQDVSDNFFVEGGRNVLGSLPFANRPFKRRATRVATEFQGSLDQFIDDVSPDIMQVRRLSERVGDREAARFLEELNQGAFDNLSSGFEVLRRERDLRFVELKRIAEQLETRAQDSGMSLLTPTLNTRRRLGDTALELGESQLLRPDGSVIERTGALKQAEDFLVDIGAGTVAPRMSFMQLSRLKRRISEEIDQVATSPDAARYLTRVKEGVELDMAEAAALHPQLNRAYQDAMDISEEFITLLGDVSTRRMKRVQKGFGRRALQEVETETGEMVAKDQGALDISQTVDLISRSASPHELRAFFSTLERGVGQQEAQRTIRLALGKKLQEAIEASFREGSERAASASYVPGVLLDKLGLASTVDKRYAPTVALFEAAGIPVSRARRSAQVLDALFSVKNPRVAQMLARQTALGGPKTLLKSLTAGAAGGQAASAAASSTLPYAVGLFLLSRSAGKWMTVPWRARAVVTMADLSLPQHARLQATYSLLSDREMWTGDNENEAAMGQEVRAELIRGLQTKRGQEQFFRYVDEQLAPVLSKDDK